MCDAVFLHPEKPRAHPRPTAPANPAVTCRPEQGIPNDIVGQNPIAAHRTSAQDGQPSNPRPWQESLAPRPTGNRPAARHRRRSGPPAHQAEVQELKVPPRAVGIEHGSPWCRPSWISVCSTPAKDRLALPPGTTRMLRRTSVEESSHGAQTPRSHFDLHQGGGAVHLVRPPRPRERRLQPRGSGCPRWQHHHPLSGMRFGHVFGQEGHPGMPACEIGIEHARRVRPFERSPEVGQDEVGRTRDAGPGAYRLEGRAPEGSHHHVHRAAIKERGPRGH